MTFSTSWASPGKLRNRLVGWVARLPARVQTKLLIAFLTIVGLLIVLGAVGLQVVNGVNSRTEELIKLQRKIAAYHQVQHDTTNQLYNISTALLLQDDKMLDAALRQLSQFGYDLDRMEFIAKGEADLLAGVRKDYDRFTQFVTQSVQLIRSGRTAEARSLQAEQVVPIADHLERLTNQLVNIAEADMVSAIDASGRTYRTSRVTVVAFALASTLLALGLGYFISWSLVEPVKNIEARLRQIAGGEFAGHVNVDNRDELGVLAASVNRTSEQLGRLYREIEERNRDLTEALEQQTATSTILRAIAASPTDVQPVLDAVAESATKLCEAYDAGILLRDGDSLVVKAHHGPIPFDFAKFAIGRGWLTGRAFLDRKPVLVADLQAEAEEFPDGYAMAMRLGHRTMLALPLLREDVAIGALILRRLEVRPFTQKQIDLLTTFADQAVIAIENVRLFEEVQARNRDLSEALEQQTATAAVLRVIAASPTDIQPVMNTLVESAAKLCGASDVVIGLSDSGGKLLFMKAHHGSIPIDSSGLPITRDWPAGCAFLDRQAVHVHDIMDAAGEFPFGHAMAVQNGFRTSLAVPLLREGEAIGIVGIRRKEVRPFSEKQIALLTTFADQAVIAIENVRLFEEVQQRNRELIATSDVLRVISRSPTDVQPVFEAIAESAARLCGSEFAYVERFDGSLLHLGAIYGLAPAAAEATRRAFPMPPGRGTAGARAVLTGEVVQIPDYESDPDFALKSLVNGENLRSAVAVPMLRDGMPIGAIVLDRTQTGYYPARQVELLKTFADQAVIAIENVRLFREVEARTEDLSEALQQQTATAEVLQVISRSTFDLPAVLSTLVNSAAKLCNVNYGGIFLREGETLRGSVRISERPANLGALEYVMLADRKTISGRVVISGRAEHIPDVETDPDYEVQIIRPYTDSRALMGVPMLRDGKVDGVFFLGKPDPGAFTSRQAELVQTFADQAVIAIENVRLFEEVQARTRELQESLEYQTATSEILNVISRSPTDIQPVMDVVAENAARVCGATDAIIFRVNGDVLRLVAAHGPMPTVQEVIELGLPVTRGTTSGRAVIDRQSIHVTDLAAELETEYPDAKSYQKLIGHRTVLSTPLLRDGVPLGVIHIRRMEVKPFSEKQIALLETFADQAVIAIENVRLFEEVKARTGELARSVEEMRALGEVSQAVNSTLDIRTVLETIVAKAVQLSGTEAGAIYVYSKTADRFRLRATYGMTDELIAAITGQPIGLNDPGLGEAARRRAPVQAPDLKKDMVSPALKIILDSGYRAVLIVPLLGPNKIVGALVVRRRTPGLFPEETVRLLETFAAQSVLAIQNARLFNEIEENGRQLEIASRHKSQFLANMSHELRTPLNSVLGFTEMLSDGLYGELPEKAKTALSRVQANGKHLLGLINDVLDLSKIEAGELKLALEDYSAGQIVKTVEAAVEPLARAKGLKLSTKIGRNLPLGRGDERRLTQVLLNLAGNAVKFTDAGSVKITAAARNGCLEFTVEDSGPGIAAEQQALIFEEFHQVDDSSTRRKGGTGLGLAISKRIIEMHSGEIAVDSAIGSGSTFRVTIPVRVEERLRAT